MLQSVSMPIDLLRNGLAVADMMLEAKLEPFQCELQVCDSAITFDLKVLICFVIVSCRCCDLSSMTSASLPSTDLFDATCAPKTSSSLLTCASVVGEVTMSEHNLRDLKEHSMRLTSTHLPLALLAQ
jgi:hypothetical protein